MNKSIRTAELSDCGLYRYTLSRGECSNPLVFIMLNPSTADHTDDDPTIRRCLGFAEANGNDGIIVLNLYALRSTNPKNLWASQDPVGVLNDVYLGRIADSSKQVVCAWGKNAKPDRVRQVVELLTGKGINLQCLGVNKDNSPKHPLYLSNDSKIIEWGSDKA